MTGQDWLPIVQAVIAAVAAIITAMAGIYVPRLVAAFEARTAIALTDQQRAAVMGAVTTAVGLIQTKLDTGLIKAADVTPQNSEIRAAAAAALDRVVDSATAQGATVATAATMVAARVDTTPQPVITKPY